MLEGRGLTKVFTSGFFGKKRFFAVRDVDISIKKGEVITLLGESGSGKSTLAKLLCLLLETTEGDVLLDGFRVTKLRGKELKNFRKKVQMIPQHPEEALDPRWKILDSVVEPAKIHGIIDKDEEDFAIELVELVGLKKEHLERYPKELSGGELQRVVISRAISLQPHFLICDEPTSMLDASIQALIIRLLLELQKKFKMGILFITHDVDLARAISDKSLIMFRCEIVEETSLENALHPYTKLLMSSEIPEIHNFSDQLSGCQFFSYCDRRLKICETKKPELIDLGEKKVRCHLYS
ncbi:MAG: ABC transporter ATP-binding protein [Candidatus Bathyarchaeia archaeon]